MTTPRRPEIFRVEGIQHQATVEDLITALSAKFSDDEKGIKIEATIVLSCETYNNTNTGLVCFIPKVPRYLAPLRESDDDIQIDTSVGDLCIDKHFYGLTQLYNTTPEEKIAAE